MREGAFALIDCLGFKGIWNRTDANLVLKKLREISSTVKNQFSRVDKKNRFFDKNIEINLDEVDVETSFFSDTVFIGIQFKNPSEQNDDLNNAFLIQLLARIAIRILDLFASSEPHLVMRGCIAYGEFICEGDFYAGPAVDFAAENMDIADGAFTWLHKSAADQWDKGVKILLPALIEKIAPIPFSLNEANIFGTGVTFLRYDMPLKQKGKIECYILNPFFQKEREARKALIHIYAKQMESNRLDVWIKQQNTSRFLESADQFTETYSVLEKKLNDMNFANILNRMI